MILVITLTQASSSIIINHHQVAAAIFLAYLCQVELGAVQSTWRHASSSDNDNAARELIAPGETSARDVARRFSSCQVLWEDASRGCLWPTYQVHICHNIYLICLTLIKLYYDVEPATGFIASVLTHAHWKKATSRETWRSVVDTATLGRCG